MDKENQHVRLDMAHFGSSSIGGVSKQQTPEEEEEEEEEEIEIWSEDWQCYIFGLARKRDDDDDVDDERPAKKREERAGRN